MMITKSIYSDLPVASASRLAVVAAAEVTEEPMPTEIMPSFEDAASFASRT